MQNVQRSIRHYQKDQNERRVEMTEKEVKATLLKAFGEISRLADEYQTNGKLLNDLEQVILGVLIGEISIEVSGSEA